MSYLIFLTPERLILNGMMIPKMKKIPKMKNKKFIITASEMTPHESKRMDNIDLYVYVPESRSF